MKTKKTPVLRIKEAREIIETHQQTIARLQEEVKSITGARDNCLVMYKYHKKQTDDAGEKITQLENQVRVQSKLLDSVQHTLFEVNLSLARYKSESARDVLSRGLALAKDQVIASIKNFVARVRFKIGL